MYTYDNGQNWFDYGFEKVDNVTVNFDNTTRTFEVLSVVSDTGVSIG